jgi:glucose/arabinose dehydrogenase
MVARGVRNEDVVARGARNEGKVARSMWNEGKVARSVWRHVRTVMRHGVAAVFLLGLAAPAPAAAAGSAGGWPALSPGREVARAREPVFITHAGDGSGRVFIGERAGRVLVLGDGAPAPVVYLDLGDRVAAEDGGLRGLVFPADFVDRRYFVLSYVGKDHGDLIVSRFRLTRAGAGDPSSEQVLLDVPLPGAERPGGGLAFGLDGKLYIGVGEGVPAAKSRGAAQDPASPLGKILRLDADPGAAHAGPLLDNPYAKRPGARPDIWATGLGNPAWLGVDPKSGDLYVVDSRGDRAEEVQVQPGTSMGGENYGWNVAEGKGCRGSTPCEAAGLTPPAAFLERPGACEVVGGVVPQAGGPLPPGTAILAERCSGRILGMRPGDGEAWESQLLPAIRLRMTAVGAGDNGRIYAADGATGRIVELVASPAASRP